MALRDQVDELSDVVSGLTDTELATPSACPGWTVSDVLVHLAQTNELAVASVEGRFRDVARGWDSGGAADVDEWAGAAVELSSRRSGPAVRSWWQESADEMVAAFSAIDPRARVEWVVGDMAARTLCTTRLSETWIHTLDIADGLGVEVPPTARLWHVARLVHRTIPYAFGRAGRSAPSAVRFELVAPDGAVWTFGPDEAATVISGPAVDLCLVAGQRADRAARSLTATGPDGDAVLDLVRTFA